MRDQMKILQKTHRHRDKKSFFSDNCTYFLHKRALRRVDQKSQPNFIKLSWQHIMPTDNVEEMWIRFRRPYQTKR